MLELLGLSGRGEAVYRAMLAHPDYGVTGLAATTGLPETEIRAALDELGDLALLKPSAGPDGGLRPVSPAVGLGPLLAAAEASVAAKHAQIEAARATIAEIAAAHEGSRAGEGVLRLEGLDAVRARLEELEHLTEFECLSLNPGGAHRPDAREAGSAVNQRALERGVSIRAICRDSFRNDPDTLAHVRWMTGHGGQMRTVPTVPVPLIIVDRKIAVLPLDPADPRAGALEVRLPGMLATACALFEQIWATGTPFGEAAKTDRHGCTPTERALLDIIGAGSTDDVAARKLGLSLRTVRRMMSDLMVRLDAGSRFQAGVSAAQRGWL